MLNEELKELFTKDIESISGDNASERLKSLDKILENFLNSKHRSMLRNRETFCQKVIDHLGGLHNAIKTYIGIARLAYDQVTKQLKHQEAGSI